MKVIRIGACTLPLARAGSFFAALALWILGFVFMQFTAAGNGGLPAARFLPLLPFLASWFLAGLPVLKNAAVNLVKGKALDENFLMSTATIGAFAIGEWAEAAGVMIFYMIGELIQEAAVNRSRSSIDALLALKPDKARVEDSEGLREVAAADVNPGSLVLVRPGERIPLDGIIVEGESFIDVSMLTGESRPVTCVAGDEVRSGTVSLDGALRIKTTRSAGDSSAARIIRLVESAREAKAVPERFITAFARWYTPLVVGGAFLLAVLPPLFIQDARFGDWLYRALDLLVISCPCALVVSVPLGYFAGIGGMSRRGIMVKGAVHLDSLNKAKNVVFDKTGTLTMGKFSIAAVEPAPNESEEELIKTAVLAEQQSNHPIAKAILEYAQNSNLEAPREKPRFSEIAGQGLEVVSGGVKILAGNRRLLESRLPGVLLPAAEGNAGSHTAVYVARDNRFLGRILIGDTLKEGALEAVSRIKSMGIRSAMFTGDTRSSAMETASQLGIDSVKTELLPGDKLRELEKLTLSGARNPSGTTVFVGDGINDAPVLAGSDVGIAMGPGADAAIEAADVIVMTGDIRRIPELIERARKTHRIVMGNVVFALGAKGLFIGLASLGMANMWIALIADVGVALAAILNSTRALR